MNLYIWCCKQLFLNVVRSVRNALIVVVDNKNGPTSVLIIPLLFPILCYFTVIVCIPFSRTAPSFIWERWNHVWFLNIVKFSVVQSWNMVYKLCKLFLFGKNNWLRDYLLEQYLILLLLAFIFERNGQKTALVVFFNSSEM